MVLACNCTFQSAGLAEVAMTLIRSSPSWGFLHTDEGNQKRNVMLRRGIHRRDFNISEFSSDGRAASQKEFFHFCSIFVEGGFKMIR